jgi:hypothetical protein
MPVPVRVSAGCVHDVRVRDHDSVSRLQTLTRTSCTCKISVLIDR